MSHQQEVVSKYKAKVVVSKNLASQIQYLHNRCPKGDEWSGLLIWQLLEGSIDDLENVRIKAEAVFPMDFGTATFTSFEGNEDWIRCFEQYPQVDPMNPQPGWYVSKIHSHNTMNVFHSGTDKNDLYENASKLPMFLSLIVNYACELDCELAISMEIEETVYKKTNWKLKGWRKFEKEVAQDKIKRTQVLILKCDTSYEQDTWLAEQCDRLKKPKITTGSGYTPGTTYTPAWMSEKDKNKTTHDKDSEIRVPQYVQHKITAKVTELLTLGTNSMLIPSAAMDQVDTNTQVNMRQDYKNALKYYFIDTWFDQFFTTVNTSEAIVIEGLRRFVSQHNRLWLAKVLTEALDELEAEYSELRKVQESSLV